MAKNFVQPGEVVTLTAPTGGLKSGDGFMTGSLFAIAMTDAAEGLPVEGAITGVWLLPKPATVVTFAVGARVSWDISARNCTVPATGCYPIGAAGRVRHARGKVTPCRKEFSQGLAGADCQLNDGRFEG